MQGTQKMENTVLDWKVAHEVPSHAGTAYDTKYVAYIICTLCYL